MKNVLERGGVRLERFAAKMAQLHPEVEHDIPEPSSLDIAKLAEQGAPDSICEVTRPMRKVPKQGNEGLALLSPRETEVFVGLAHGETQREVAEHLGLSVKTVETYRARIGDKLGLKTRADLVRYALAAGVLKPPGVEA